VERKAARLRQAAQTAALRSPQPTPQHTSEREGGGGGGGGRSEARPAGAWPPAVPPLSATHAALLHGEAVCGRGQVGRRHGASVEDDEEFWREMVREREREKALEQRAAREADERLIPDETHKPDENHKHDADKAQLQAYSLSRGRGDDTTPCDSLDGSSPHSRRQVGRRKPSIHMLASLASLARDAPLHHAQDGGAGDVAAGAVAGSGTGRGGGSAKVGGVVRTGAPSGSAARRGRSGGGAGGGNEEEGRIVMSSAARALLLS
jgi:hypothetical protein